MSFRPLFHTLVRLFRLKHSGLCPPGLSTLQGLIQKNYARGSAVFLIWFHFVNEIKIVVIQRWPTAKHAAINSIELVIQINFKRCMTMKIEKY